MNARFEMKLEQSDKRDLRDRGRSPIVRLLADRHALLHGDKGSSAACPKMAALPTDRQRRFVCGLFEAPLRVGRVTFATKRAGYGTATSSNGTIRAIGGRLMSSEAIQSAIAEEAQKRLRSLAPSAVVAIESLVNHPEHRDHGRALAMIFDRSDPVSTTHNVTVSDNRMPPMAIEKVLARIEELTSRVGVPSLPAPKIIEGEAVEIGGPA